MSDTNFKVQVSYDDPSITSCVPGEQKFRDVSPKDNSLELPGTHTIEDNQDKTHSVEETSKHDDVFTPVLKVTKEEAIFTKGDLKMQKVTVTEDISVANSTTTMGRENVTNNDLKTRDEVFTVQHVTDKTEEKEPMETRKPKTRIPTLRFRQAVDKLTRDQTSYEDKKESETPQPTPRRSSIPRLKDVRIQPTNIKDVPLSKEENAEAIPRLSDEFDKLYNEIADDQDSLDNLSIISRIEDPVKLDSTFDEIIHAYEENKCPPINVEKTKQSKIPLLKRKSENEIEIPKTIGSVLRQSVSVDVGKMKASQTSTEHNSKIYSVTLNKSPIRTNLVSNRVPETKSIQTSKTNSSESVKTINFAKVKESNNNQLDAVVNTIISEEVVNKPLITTDNKENINIMEKETVKVATPTIEYLKAWNDSFKSKTEDNAQNTLKYETKPIKGIQEQNIHTHKPETHIILQTENKADTVEEQQVTSINIKEKIVKTDHKDIEDCTCIEKSSDSEVQEEDISILRGKVNRIIKRMDSKDADVKQIKKDLKEEVPIKRSILSKIAKFEHSEPTGVTLKSKVSSTAKMARNDSIEHSKNENDLCNATPKIVEEVLKDPTPVENGNNNDGNNEFNKSLVFTSDQNSVIHPTNDKPNYNGHTVETETANIGPQKHSIDPVHISAVNTETNNLNKVIIFKENDLHHVATEINPPSIIQNHPENVYNIQSPTIDRNKIHVTHDIDLKQILETRPHITPANTFGRLNDSIKNDLNSINNTPQVIPDIAKEEIKSERKSNDEQLRPEMFTEKEILHRNAQKDEGMLRIHAYRNNELNNNKIKSKSLAELDLGETVKGRVKNMVGRINSFEKLDGGKNEIIDIRERPRKRSVSEKIALFERKLTPVRLTKHDTQRTEAKNESMKTSLSEEEYSKIIEELTLAKIKYGMLDQEKMKYLELKDGGRMPVIGIGTALLDPKLTRHVVKAAIDLGYRTIDTAYIYGNEKEVGEAIKEKINDGTVTRSDLFVISKLWSSFHRRDLVAGACKASLDAMGLQYFDLYLVHNPMSFKEGGPPIPKIANVIQYSEHDYMDAWFGVEDAVRKGFARRGGLSNFNSLQVERVVDKAKIKPVLNQVECHPYLSQHRLDEFCQTRNVQLCCFGVLGSKGTPQGFRSALPPAIDDPLVRVMSAGLGVSPAMLLVSYQLAQGRAVVVKASSAAHLWDNLQSLSFTPSIADVSALHALNRNKRTFTFKGMGDTHKNYPFKIPF